MSSEYSRRERLTRPKHQLSALLAMQRRLAGSQFPGAKILLAFLMWLVALLFGCDISPQARIPRSVRFPHPTGIVIGVGAKLGERVTIYQNVTLGSHGKPGSPVQYPYIDDDVTIYAGAAVLGAVTVGKRSVIGANAVVSVDVAPDSLVVAPAPISKKIREPVKS